MNEQISETATNRLRGGIAGIRGWNSVLGRSAQGMGHAFHLGRLISSVSLTAGDNEPLAITGALDDDEHGYLAVAYDSFLIVADVERITDKAGKYTVRLYGWGSVESVEVSTRYNYFSEAEESGPQDTMDLLLTVAGQPVFFKVRDGDSPLVKGPAIHSVLMAIRAYLSAR